MDRHKLVEELSNKYTKNPPEGMTSEDIHSMSKDDLLDMDFFLHGDDDPDDDLEKGFYIF